MYLDSFFLEFFEEAQMLKDYKNQGKKAIDSEISVPLVKFPGISGDECVKIHDLAVELLRVARDENNSNEVAITYLMGYNGPQDDYQKYRPMVKGDEHGVNIESDPDSYHLVNTTGSIVLVNLHNHPSGSDISIEDLMYFIKKQSIRMMVILPNDGGLYYIIKDPEKYNRKEAMIKFADVVSTISPKAYKDGKICLLEMTYEDLTKIAENFIREASALGIDYEYVPSDDYMEEKEGDEKI